MISRTMKTTSKDLGHRGVLVLQVGVGTLADGLRDLLHRGIAL